MVWASLPIADGPAGSWVSIFVILGQVAMHQGQSAKDVLQLLEGGLIIAGILLFFLGITGLVHRILRLFTPLVTGTFLLILSLQLSVLLKGMIGLQDLQPILTIQQLLLLSLFCPYYFLIN